MKYAMQLSLLTGLSRTLDEIGHHVEKGERAKQIYGIDACVHCGCKEVVPILKLSEFGIYCGKCLAQVYIHFGTKDDFRECIVKAINNWNQKADCPLSEAKVRKNDEDSV